VCACMHDGILTRFPSIIVSSRNHKIARCNILDFLIFLKSHSTNFVQLCVFLQVQYNLIFSFRTVSAIERLKWALSLRVTFIQKYMFTTPQHTHIHTYIHTGIGFGDSEDYQRSIPRWPFSLAQSHFHITILCSHVKRV
jgi:hypothetical protein